MLKNTTPNSRKCDIEENATTYTIESQRIYLRFLTIDDVTDKYVGWLNDSDINHYLLCGNERWTVQKVKDYVHELYTTDIGYLFGIFLNSGEHIGNIKIGYIDTYNERGDIGFLLDKSYWGQGYMTEAIQNVCGFGFGELQLNKLTAGVFASNIGSIKALENAGFEREGVRQKHSLLHGVFTNVIEYGLCK